MTFAETKNNKKLNRISCHIITLKSAKSDNYSSHWMFTERKVSKVICLQNKIVQITKTSLKRFNTIINCVSK